MNKYEGRILKNDNYCIHHVNLEACCIACDNFNKAYDKEFSKNRKMTREEAYNKLPIMEQVCTRDHLLNALEALGLLKFSEEEKKEVNKLFEITESNVFWPAASMYEKDQLLEFNKKYGCVRLEEWPEGLVLWVGGYIVWNNFGGVVSGIIKE